MSSDRAAVDERLERYAELGVRVGANVAEGQLVFVVARDVTHAPLIRALARAAYRAGAPTSTCRTATRTCGGR